MEESNIKLLKILEGYQPCAKWDYVRYSNGYGTKALSNNECIDQNEADTRLRKHVILIEDDLSKNEFWKKLNRNQKDALIIHTYNTGGSQNLFNAIKENEKNKIKQLWLETYITANGQKVEGLEKRRKIEYELFEKNYVLEYLTIIIITIIIAIWKILIK